MAFLCMGRTGSPGIARGWGRCLELIGVRGTDREGLCEARPERDICFENPLQALRPGPWCARGSLCSACTRQSSPSVESADNSPWLCPRWHLRRRSPQSQLLVQRCSVLLRISAISEGLDETQGLNMSDRLSCDVLVIGDGIARASICYEISGSVWVWRWSGKPTGISREEVFRGHLHTEVLLWPGSRSTS